MSSVPLLQSHINRVDLCIALMRRLKHIPPTHSVCYLCGALFPIATAIHDHCTNWQCRQKCEECITERNIAILRECCEAEGVSFTTVEAKNIPPHTCPDCYREIVDPTTHDCGAEAAWRRDEHIEGLIDEATERRVEEGEKE